MECPSATRYQNSPVGTGGNLLDGSHRWLLFEDMLAVDGAKRDMWRPECFDYPGHVRSDHFYCAMEDSSKSDHGGVPGHWTLGGWRKEEGGKRKEERGRREEERVEEGGRQRLTT